MSHYLGVDPATDTSFVQELAAIDADQEAQTHRQPRYGY